MKQILKGYASLYRELLGQPNDGAFLTPPANPLILILICGVIGLIRNALHVALGAPGFHSFQPDILWTMFAFPVQLCLFPAALLHWQLRRLGYRNLDADAVLGVAFYVQLVHFMVPFIDWVGFSLGLPPYYVIGAGSITNEWYTNRLYMTPGIIAAWWIIAYAITSVLRRRFGIRWGTLLLVSVTTFVLILFPTYFLFPALNTLFSRAFGPYLWNPLDYLFVYPKWFPFWGYGTYFAVTAFLGLAYFSKHSNNDSIKGLFRIHTARHAHAWLIGYATARYIFDLAWAPELRAFAWPLALLVYIVYQYTLYLFFPAVAGFIQEKVFSKPVDAPALLRESVHVWAVYPIVPLVSMIARTQAFHTVEWFRHIPTFTLENNYLPAGMFAVVPVLMVFFTRQLLRHSDAHLLRSLFSVVAALWVVYLLFYQYVDNLFFFTLRLYGTTFAAACYMVCFLVPLIPIAGRFHLAFGRQRLMLPLLVNFATILGVAIMVCRLAFPPLTQ